MFEGMTGSQQLQVWQWLIYGISLCVLAYTLRKACEAFWEYLKFKQNAQFSGGLSEKKQIPSGFDDFYKIHDSRENAGNPVEFCENDAKEAKVREIIHRKINGKGKK